MCLDIDNKLGDNLIKATEGMVQKLRKFWEENTEKVVIVLKNRGAHVKKFFADIKKMADDKIVGMKAKKLSEEFERYIKEIKDSNTDENRRIASIAGCKQVIEELKVLYNDMEKKSRLSEEDLKVFREKIEAKENALNEALSMIQPEAPVTSEEVEETESPAITPDSAEVDEPEPDVSTEGPEAASIDDVSAAFDNPFEMEPEDAVQDEEPAEPTSTEEEPEEEPTVSTEEPAQEEEPTTEEKDETSVDLDDLTQFESYREYVEAYCKVNRKQEDKDMFYLNLLDEVYPQDLLSKDEFIDKRREQIDNRTLGERDQEILGLKKEITDKNAENRTANERIADLEREIADKDARLTETREENKTLTKGNADLNAEIASKDTLIGQLENKVSMAESRLTASQDQVYSLEGQLKDIKAQIKRLEEANARVEEALAKAEEARKAAEEETVRTKERMADLQNGITSTINAAKSDEDELERVAREWVASEKRKQKDKADEYETVAADYVAKSNAEKPATKRKGPKHMKKAEPEEPAAEESPVVPDADEDYAAIEGGVIEESEAPTTSKEELEELKAKLTEQEDNGISIEEDNGMSL